uniref:Uncharacterized protein n=1 Tax=Anopheles atroparvus TaxID=41427 RepID=A0AAG5DCC6_ANOAO
MLVCFVAASSSLSMFGKIPTGKRSVSAGSPAEITAEWTVHAQLTLSSSASSSANRPSECKANQEQHLENSEQTYNASEDHSAERNTDKGGVAVGHEDSSTSQPFPPVNIHATGCSTTSASGNPVKVVYKFSTTDNPLQQKSQPTASTQSTIFPLTVSSSSVGKSSVIYNNDPSSHPPATGVKFAQTPTDDGHPLLDGDTSDNSHLFPKCTSTCSIVLTACTDLLTKADSLPIIINKCESSNNIVVDKSTNFPEKSPSNAKNASCQTSDWESTDATNTNIQTDLANDESMRRRPTQKSITSATLLSPPPRRRGDKLDTLLRTSVSPANPIISPSNTIRSQQSSVLNTSVAKKKPRTVHIDVYCTGSDAESFSSSSCCSSSGDDEENSQGGISSSCSSGSRFDTSHMMELKSNSKMAHPSIFESEEMKVRHKRAGKHEVPRRLMQQPIEQNTLSTIGSLKKSAGESSRHGRIKKCTTSDEINESKHILFSKHLGDVAAQPTEVKDFKVYFRRDVSDDAISSNYAMSNRSTRRDITGSSLSSIMAGGVCDEVEELEETTNSNVKLNRSGTSGTQSDSFEYENSEDRIRIYEMERVWNQQHWKSPSVERKLLELHNPNHLGKQSPLLFRSDSENNLTESDHSFVYDNAPSSLQLHATHHESNPSLNEYSDSSPSTVKSASQRTPESGRAFLQQAVLAATLQQQQQQPRGFSPVEGYTNEYLAIARRFGSLIMGRRKPGTHMGPVRNPECPCAHCRRWIAEREKGGESVTVGARERAFSVDGTANPSNIVDMRRRLHMRNLL